MKRFTRVLLWSSIALVALFVCGWILLFSKPTLAIPKFARGLEVANSETYYYEGVHTVVRGGVTKHIPETTVVERCVMLSRSPFLDVLESAERELTAERGWDLGAVPKDQVARFYQRSTNTSVTLWTQKGEVRIGISQNRFATPTDRLRHWWQGLRSGPKQ
jgi:hypothetical protein